MREEETVKLDRLQRNCDRHGTKSDLIANIVNFSRELILGEILKPLLKTLMFSYEDVVYTEISSETYRHFYTRMDSPFSKWIRTQITNGLKIAGWSSFVLYFNQVFSLILLKKKNTFLNLISNWFEWNLMSANKRSSSMAKRTRNSRLENLKVVSRLTHGHKSALKKNW